MGVPRVDQLPGDRLRARPLHLHHRRDRMDAIRARHLGQYGVSADPSKPGAPPDPYDPWDAIFAAARYLHASGAPADWLGALYVYDNAGWYAQRSASRAQRYITAAGGAVFVSYPAASCSQPVSRWRVREPVRAQPGPDGGADRHGRRLRRLRRDRRDRQRPDHVRRDRDRRRLGLLHPGERRRRLPTHRRPIPRRLHLRHRGRDPHRPRKDSVTAGQQVATFTSPRGCLEIGFADGPAPAPKAAALGQQAQRGDAGDNRTYCGQQMSDLLAATGAPAGLPEGRPVTGDHCE